MTYLDNLLFGYYPYICLSIFLLGSLLRFDRDQYTWKSDSSQLLRAGQLRWGSNLFHVGVLFLLGGHTFGMLTPHFLYEPFMSAGSKQIMAMVSGGAFGILGFIGVSMLLQRRLGDERILLLLRRVSIDVEVHVDAAEAVADVRISPEDAQDVHLALDRRGDRPKLDPTALCNRGDAGREAATERGEDNLHGRGTTVFRGEDRRVIGVKRERVLVLVLLAQPRVARHGRLAVGAMDPAGGRAPGELGGLR